jgi:hypothetical protein
MAMLRYVCNMSNESGSLLETDRAFGLGLMYGQITVHCEHVRSGGKLAAQLGCSRDNTGLACDAIKREGCQFIVEEDASDRVSIWIYKKAIAETLIRVLKTQKLGEVLSRIIHFSAAC